ncbi:MAG TPA: Eco29kI family restriction endonuclease [Herpetosiphonaceae bacterium]
MSAFNPLDKRNLGISVANQLLMQPLSPLPPVPFEGAGIYAIYYSAVYQPYPLYQPFAIQPNQPSIPIYVGKAVPDGARIGGLGLNTPPGTVLFRRLREHASSIAQVDNLALEDFSCRYLIVDDIWIPLGESLLIEMFAPIWNTTIAGFGNHDPGSGRYNQQRSVWDTLHPGRPWATNLRLNARSTDDIIALVQQTIATRQLRQANSDNAQAEDE